MNVWPSILQYCACHELQRAVVQRLILCSARPAQQLIKYANMRKKTIQLCKMGEFTNIGRSNKHTLDQSYQILVFSQWEIWCTFCNHLDQKIFSCSCVTSEQRFTSWSVFAYDHTVYFRRFLMDFCFDKDFWKICPISLSQKRHCWFRLHAKVFDFFDQSASENLLANRAIWHTVPARDFLAYLRPSITGAWMQPFWLVQCPLGSIEGLSTQNFCKVDVAKLYLLMLCAVCRPY